MLTEEERRRAAADILQAERERKPIPQLSRTFPQMEMEDAYRVRAIALDFLRLGRGWRPSRRYPIRRA